MDSLAEVSSTERYEEIAKAMRVDLDFLDAAVRKATGVAVAGTPTQLFKGEANAVFDVALADGRHVIARQSHSKDASSAGSGRHRFYQEARVIAAAKAAGVPTADVLLVEEASSPGGGFCVSIQTKLPGRPLIEAIESGELTTAQVQRILREVRSAAALLHGIPTDVIETRGPSSVDALEGWASRIRYAVDAGRLAHNVRSLVDRAMDELASPHYVADSVIHDDWHPKHMFVHEGHLSGVIDFETAAIGDPAFDFAWWRYWQKPADSSAVELYPDIMHPDAFGRYGADFGVRVRWAEMLTGVSTISFYLDQADSGKEQARLMDAIYASEYLDRALSRPIYTGAGRSV